MIDIRLIRENPEAVKENIKKKFQEEKLPLVDEVLKLDEAWRKLKSEGDSLRSQRNKVSEEINLAKKSGKDVAAVIEKAKVLPKRIAEIEEEDKRLEEEIKRIMFQIPNIIHNSVPIGKDDSENVEIKKIGTPKKKDFSPKNHIEIGETLRVLDCDTSAAVTGKGFYYMRGKLAELNMALINFAREYMVSQGFEYTEPPLMIRKEILTGVYSKAEIDAMAYKVENEDLYLIATSEHPLIGQFINRTVPSKALPVKQTAYSMCFRREIGSHGIGEKGLYRTHQFNKQEMIVICEPEDSYAWYDKMLNYALHIFKELELPVRVIECCSGDLGDLKAKSCDVEAWSPVQEKYYEVGSLTNTEEAQARRLNIRIEGKGKLYYAHTLNNTVIATSRALVAILENHQQKDGSIKIPKALQKYTGFDEITPVNALVNLEKKAKSKK
jgi:seryl-tRNA synthetase